MTTAYVTHTRYLDHYMPGYQHPEFPGRLKSVWETLQTAGLIDRMYALMPTPADRETLLSVHTPEHLNLLDWVSGQGKATMVDADTYARPESYEIARLAAGGVIQAVDAVLCGAADNALAAVRPPGHHATPTYAMGFCLLSNIAIAARYAQRAYGINRVMIVDYDVHHGNGTQDVFYDDKSVLFVSSHQYPFYPGTGSIHDIGHADARGTTLNIPLPGGHGDSSFAALYEEILWPVARRFEPDLILVSAGFDAHWHDPLAYMRLSLNGYDHLTRELMRMADDLCGGKIVFVLEGGYDLQALGHGVANVARALLGDPAGSISDPYGPASGDIPDILPLIRQLKQIHKLG